MGKNVTKVGLRGDCHHLRSGKASVEGGVDINGRLPYPAVSSVAFHVILAAISYSGALNSAGASRCEERREVALELLSGTLRHACGQGLQIPLYLSSDWKPKWPILEAQKPDCVLSVSDKFVVDLAIVKSLAGSKVGKWGAALKQVVLGFGQQDVSLMIFLHGLHSNVLLLVVVTQILYHCAMNLEVCVLKAIKGRVSCARDMVAEVHDVGTCGADREKLRHRLFQYMEASRHYKGHTGLCPWPLTKPM